MTQNDSMTELRQQALVDINEAQDERALQDVKVKYLGKKGSVSGLMKNMKDLPNEEKPAYGQKVNELRQAIQNELDYYNFEALNLPKSHPARDMQDSFYITDEILMRTHTSPVQARTMEKRHGQGPVKIICPGKVYRRDSDDATHSHQFTQIEGLVVDKHIKMSDLKGTLELVAKKLFGADREIRLRPSYFPFTEPSVEVDVSCFKCKGKGCNVCKHTGWIEILGAGMVHPNVLEMAGFDSNEYSGFAFGMGPDRIAMLKYGIEDIRHFYTNDVRFLNQFKAVEDRGEA